MKPLRAFLREGTEETKRVWILEFLFTDRYGGYAVIYCDEKTGQVGVSVSPESFSINTEFMNNGR